MAPRVCIIGGGAIGLSTAVHLTERGIRDVTLLEAEDLAAGSSSRSAGFVESQYVDPLDVETRARSMHFFRRLQRDEGLEIKEIGYLRLAHSADLLESFEASVRLQRELGIEHARVVDRTEIRRLFPDMRCDDVAGGLWGPRDGRIDGPAYCRILAGLAEAGGARILTGRHVSRVEPIASGGHRVATGREELECDLVVNAAGGWATKVGRLLGIEVPVAPVRHQIAIMKLERPLDYVLPMVMDYIPHSGQSGFYAARYDTADQVLAGLHSEEILGGVVDPDDYQQEADPLYLEELRERLPDRLPGLPVAGITRSWAGIYPTSPDGLPQVGPVPGHPSVILAVGGGGSGIQLSPIIGALAADWIAYGEPRSLSNGAALAPGRPSLGAAAG